MASPSPPSDLTSLPADELRALVTDLVAQLQAVREENAALKDEIARLSCGRPAWSRRPRQRRAGHAARHGDAGAAPRAAGW